MCLPWAIGHSEDRLPTVFFLHAYVALDQETYDALRTSPQIAALGGTEERHTVAGDDDWTGFYLYGRQTFLEFFGADGLPANTRQGDCGLGLNVETSGGVAAAASHLHSSFGERVETGAHPRITANGSIPWIKWVDIKSNGPEVLTTWVDELEPGYLAGMHPGARIDHPLSRQQDLSWNFLPDHPLDNVVGVTVALNAAAMSQLSSELQLLGWRVHAAGKGFVANGPDLQLTAEPSQERTGIREIDLQLRQPVPQQTIQLGAMQLELHQAMGRISFQPGRPEQTSLPLTPCFADPAPTAASSVSESGTSAPCQ
jgi:hypothetical protein